MRLTVLGSSGGYPAPGSACSGYLLEDADTRLWIDAGSGTFARLLEHCTPDRLSAVLASTEGFGEQPRLHGGRRDFVGRSTPEQSHRGSERRLDGGENDDPAGPAVVTPGEGDSLRRHRGIDPDHRDG